MKELHMFKEIVRYLKKSFKTRVMIELPTEKMQLLELFTGTDKMDIYNEIANYNQLVSSKMSRTLLE